MSVPYLNRLRISPTNSAPSTAMPAYTSRPNLTLGFGLKITDLVERLAKQVEALQ